VSCRIAQRVAQLRPAHVHCREKLERRASALPKVVKGKVKKTRRKRTGERDRGDEAAR